MLLTLSTDSQPEQEEALNNLTADLSTTKELLLDQHVTEQVQAFKKRHPVDWLGFSTKSVLKCLESEDKQANSLMRLVVQVV